jgi:hypothetical protein
MLIKIIGNLRKRIMEGFAEITLLYNHSVQEGVLHKGDTSIKPRTRCLYFICSSKP